MENVGLFLHDNQGQCVWQKDARSWAFRQNNQKSCSCGERAVGAGSAAKVRVGCGHHIVEPASSLFRLQSCCPSWLVPFTPSLTCRSPFVCGNWAGFVFFKGRFGSSVHSYFLALSPRLNCAFSHPVLQVTSHLLTCCCWVVVEIPCGLIYILVYVLAWSCALTQMLYISHFQRLILSQSEGSKHPSPLRLMNLVPALIITVNGLAKDCLLKHQKTTVRAFCLHFQ